jgi:hypothetical protein
MGRKKAKRKYERETGETVHDVDIPEVSKG